MVSSLAPGGAHIGDDAPFDLRSYLGSEEDDIFLDGWDDLPYVGDDEGGERAAHGITRESLLPDDVLDELIRAQQVEHNSAVTANATSNRHGTASKVPDTAKPNKKKQGAVGNMQAQKQRNFSDAGSPSKPASDMPPATTIGQAMALGKAGPTDSSSNNTSKGEPSIRKRRRMEDPSVLDMARRLIEARKSEQSTNLASETSTLCEDNHRLILYLKQLGEKLTKARLENTLLKQLVGENVGHGHAEHAQMLASTQPELAANMGQEKSSRLSVADKVSALSVKHMHSQDGTPVACLRPSINATSPPAPATPSPPNMPIVNMSKPRTLGEVSRNQQQQQQLQLIQQMQQHLQPHQLQGHQQQQHQQQQQQQRQQQQHHHQHQLLQQQQQQQQQYHQHQQQQQLTLQGREDSSGGNPQQFALQAAAAMQANSSNPAGVIMDLLKLMEKQMKKGTSTTHTSS